MPWKWEAEVRSPVMRELIETIGEEAAFKLLKAYGGSRVYVPHAPNEQDQLTLEIGIAAASKLARRCGGDRLELPKANLRRSKILELRRAGMSVDAIARQTGCTRRRVFQVLAEARPAITQRQGGTGIAEVTREQA